MAYTISQNLNIRPKYFPHVVVHVSAGDANIPVHFSIYDGASTYTIPSGTTITVHGYRKDGGNWITNGTYSGNVVSFSLPRAAMAIEGAGIADVVFTTGTEVVGSANFCLLVERATFPNGVAYSNDSSVFQDLLNFINSSAVPEAISDWLEENITATSPAVDSTLSVQGAAADAKATGDALINKSVTQASLSGNVVSFKNANNSEKFTLDLSDLDEIKTVTNTNQMTDTNSIYKYTGTNPAMIQNALYYYNGTAWVPIGQAKSGTESLQTLSIVPNWNRGALSNVGGIITNDSWGVTKTAIPVTEGTVISTEENSGIVFGVAIYSKNDVFIDFIKRSTDGLYSVTVPSDCLIRINATYSTSTTLEDEMSAAELGSLISIETQMDIVFQDTVCEMEIGDCTLNDGLPLQTKNYNVQRSKKILKTNNQKIVKLTFDPDLVANRRNIYICTYNQNGVIMGNSYLYRSRSREPEQTLILPDGVYYLKIVMSWHEANYKTSPITVSAQQKVEECFNPCPVSTELHVSYPVTAKYQTAGQLKMPPNYSFDGEPVPLIVCVHGSDLYPTYTSGVASASIPIWNYFNNEGFAVFDCFPWTTKYGFVDNYQKMYSPYVTPINQLSYLEGIKWVCSRYNVDINRVYCCCISQGGHLGQWVIMQNNTPVKAVSFLSTGLGLVHLPTGDIMVGKSGREAMQVIQQFEGTSAEIESFINTANGAGDEDIVAFCRRNMDKFVPLSPWSVGVSGATASEIFELSFTGLNEVPQWLIDKGAPSTITGAKPFAFTARQNYSKHAFVPSKFWGSYDDTSVCMFNNFAVYQYLLNGGSDTEFRALPDGTGGHYSAISFSDQDVIKTNGTTALGIEYTGVPIALVETVEFFRKKTVDD